MYPVAESVCYELQLGSTQLQLHALMCAVSRRACKQPRLSTLSQLKPCRACQTLGCAAQFDHTC